jgi:predicted nucleotidyltransferase component of viral defense system
VIPQAHITAWRSTAPWADDAQVEQDLVLARAVIELFSNHRLKDRFALRGGTALHKLLLHPPYRYSEDIDLVQTEAAPIGPLLDAIRETLDSWLGKPTRKLGAGGVTLTYRFESDILPVRPLRLKIEINTREHFALFGLQARRFTVVNPWFTGESELVTFDVNELLATKLRALYQRSKGRDLFDLWLSIEQRLIDPRRVVDCFCEYMRRENHPVSRAQFEQNLHDKETDAAFMSDIAPLLRPGLTYHAAEAVTTVRKTLIELLPGDSWRGPLAADERTPKPERRRN